MSFILVVFLIIFFIIAWFRSDYALAMIALLLPSYLIRFSIFFLPVTILEIMILIVFAVWIMKAVFNKYESGMSLKRLHFPWQWPVLFFVLAGTIAVFISPDTRQALGLWKAYIIEPVLLYIVLVNSIKTKKQVKLVVFGLGISAVFVSLIAVWQYIGWMEIPGGYGFEIPKRATSVFPFPTAVGKYIAPILGLFLGLVLAKNSIKEGKKLSWKDVVWKHIFLYGVVLFSFIALWLSFSRGALIGVFAGVLFISVFSKWRKTILISILISVLLAFAVPVTRNNIIDVFNTSDASTDVHLVMWKGAVRIIKDNPITGTGLASFPVVYDEYKEASHTEYFPNPDHLILTLWIEMGLAGLIIFFWIVFKFFKSGITIFSLDKKWTVGLMTFMVAILVHGFIDTPYFKNDLSAMFWIIVGLMVVSEKISQQQKISAEE